MRKLTTQEFIEKAKAIHGDRYDYSKTEYVKATKPVIIGCRIHGDFQQLPHNHLRGKGGCVQCNKIEGRRLGVDEFISRAREIHGDLYDYSQVVYVNTKTPAKIVCPIHGVFEQRPEKHLEGHGCPFCIKNLKDTTESFIAKARIVHGDFYDYSKVQYVDQHTPVCIIDPEYGEFWQQPISHLNGRDDYRRKVQKAWYTMYSKGKCSSAEVEVYDALVSKFGKDNVKPQHWSKLYPYTCDFYVVPFDLYMEINVYPSHGYHWFDATNADDLARAASMAELSVTNSWYKTALNVWLKVDPAKKLMALSNNLNYLVFWKDDLSDFYEWYDAFDFDNPVLKNVDKIS